MMRTGEPAAGWYASSATEWTRRPRLTFDLDVDVCVVGGGLAGLTIAREAARLGATVALLEARTIGWNASGRNLGSVRPGFGVDIEHIVSRIGSDDARELWELSQDGVDYVRSTILEAGMPGIGLGHGFLEVSSVDKGDRLIGRLQVLGEDFGADVEAWQTDRVREAIRTPHYFHAIHHPKPFHLHGLNYARGLAEAAERAGVRLFEDTIVAGIDPAGIRKRIVTAAARLRSSYIVLAGNVHLGSPFPRLNQTLLPTWRYVAVTEPLGSRINDALPFEGVIEDSSGLDQFRRIDGDRLMWSGPLTTFPVSARLVASLIKRRIKRVFPQLGDVAIADSWSGVTGETVHGMPQIGQLRRGLWIASGFGGHGIAASAMAGLLVTQGMLGGDDRWRLFSPFELVWAGGTAGRIAAQAVYAWSRGAASAAATVSRLRERARAREQERQRRAAAATQAVRRMRLSDQGARPHQPPRPPRQPPEPAQDTSRDRESAGE
jgi:glycine/D-amino acid oxidase-like deaminating enzyme